VKNIRSESSQRGGHVIRPNFQHKFRPIIVKKCMHDVMSEFLHDKQYDANEAPKWARELGELVKAKLKELELERYKFIVQVVIGEQRGEGVKMVCRCLWDSDTDNMAQDVFMNGSLFCVVAAFGIFNY